MDPLCKLPAVLLPWYERHHRKLPWREHQDPYRIWVSEIMLQQTRVEAVKGYYSRFLEALPDVEALAKADEDQLHKLWEGLGYYNRVRNMKKAAMVIVNEYNGIFPKTYDQVLALPGIGPYTAGAICSIAYDLPVAAVDGNVLRVIARLTNDASPVNTDAYKKSVQERLTKIYPKEAGAFTQALMELGATVCGPNRKPDCEQCPCRSFCMGYRMKTTDTLPVKASKRERRVEEKTVFILRCSGLYALLKRPGKGLLAGMWQFPDCPGKLEVEQIAAMLPELGFAGEELILLTERTHVFTHVQWNMRAVLLEGYPKDRRFEWFTAEQIEQQTALPTAYRQFWEEVKRY